MAGRCRLHAPVAGPPAAFLSPCVVPHPRAHPFRYLRDRFRRSAERLEVRCEPRGLGQNVKAHPLPACRCSPASGHTPSSLAPGSGSASISWRLASAWFAPARSASTAPRSRRRASPARFSSRKAATRSRAVSGRPRVPGQAPGPRDQPRVPRHLKGLAGFAACTRRVSPVPPCGTGRNPRARASRLRFRARPPHPHALPAPHRDGCWGAPLRP